MLCLFCVSESLSCQIEFSILTGGIRLLIDTSILNFSLREKCIDIKDVVFLRINELRFVESVWK